MIGSVMAGTGLSLCFFATNFYMVFAFYGLIAGQFFIIFLCIFAVCFL